MPLTKQEAFDKALAHLRQQGRKCNRGSECLYRDGDRRCAFGALIPDHLYRPDMETLNAATVLGNHPALQEILDPKDESFYMDLQRNMHDRVVDSSFAQSLEMGAQQVATKYSLEYAPPQRPEGTV
jgi:hypothetical protein